MIVHNLNVSRFAVAPSEADPPLIVNPNTVLSHPARLENFETVARGDPEIFEPPGRMQEQ